MRPNKVTESQVSFKKKGAQQQTPVNQMNKSQVSVTSEMSQSRSQKSLSQGHSRAALKSGNETLIQKMSKLPEDVVTLKQQISELKIMELSQEARESLKKLQRFDRFIFPMQSDRILKKPIQEELKRLEKIKNQQLNMRGKLYDNELTITALYNHIKLISQMNRQLEEREILRKQKDEAVKKMHDQKRESLKQVRELKQQIRMGSKNVTPVKGQQSEEESNKPAGQTTTPLKKEEITTLNFISATLRGKKYAEAIQQIKKFIMKSGSTQPQACKLLQMFLPALEDQLTTIVQTKTVETKYSEFSILIQKTNKQIRVNHFDQLEKMKVQALKSNSQFKTIGLLLQSILNMKKNDQAEKKKRGPGDDSKSLEKVNQRVKSIQDQLKATKEELFKEKAANAQTLKIKIAIEKQLQKLKSDFDRAQAELQNYKKIEADQKKLPLKNTAQEDQIKNVKQELNKEKGFRGNLEKQVQRLNVQIQNLKKSNAQTARTTSKSKQNDEQLKTTKELLKNQKAAKTLLQKQVSKLQNELKPIRDQLTNETAIRANLQKQFQRIQIQTDNLRKSEAEFKKSANRIKQSEEELKSIRQQLATEKATKVNLQRESKKLQTEVVPLRQQLTNAKSAHAELEKQFNRISNQLTQSKRADLEGKKVQSKLKQLQEEIGSLKEEISNLKLVKQNLEKENRKIQQQIKPLKDQLNNERVSKQELLRELQSFSGEVQTSKKADNELKISLVKLKQSQDEIKSLREQIANQRAKNYGLQQQIQRVTSDSQVNRKAGMDSKKVLQRNQQQEDEIASLKEQLAQWKASYNEANKTNKTLQKQVQAGRTQNQRLRRLEGDLESAKRAESDLRKAATKAKSTEDQLRKVKQNLANQIEDNKQGKRVRKNIEAQLQKLKTQNQRLQAVQVKFEQLRNIQAQFKRISQKLRVTVDQARISKQELEHQRAKIYEISREKEMMQRQIEKLLAQIQMYKKNQVQIKTRELQSIKKVELQAKSKEQLLIQNLRQDINKAESDLNYSLDSVQRIVKASNSAKAAQELEKLRRQLTSSQHSASRKILPAIETFIRSNNRSIQLESMIDKMTKQENERRKKAETESKHLTNQISQYRQNGNYICQALKSASRIWARTKSEQLYSNNKVIEILESEIKKGNLARHLQNVESEIVSIVESIANLILSELSKIEDGYIKIIEQKNRQLEKILTKQQVLTKSEAEKDKKIIELEEQLKIVNSGVEQIKREGLTYVRQIQRLMKEHERVIYQANTTAEQLHKQIENTSKLNKQILQLKKQITRLTGEKQASDIKSQEANLQISRLKKHTQDYVQQQKKVLQTLQLEGKQKQKFQRELQNLQRALEKSEKQRQFYEKKSKNQDLELMKLKEIEIIMQNTIQQNEIKSSTLATTIMTRDKEVKNLNDRHRLTIEEKDKLEQQILFLEKQLGSAKFEIQKANRQIKDSQDFNERQKHDFARQIQRLNLQIKFESQERQSDKKHHATIVLRLEKHLGDAEAHRIQQVKDIQNKMENILKQKQEARKQLENEQNKYREKLRQVNRDLELTSITGEREKGQMKRQIDRLAQQLNAAIETTEIQKAELRRSYEKIQIQKQKIIQERVQQKRVLQEEIERAKNEEYQLNYEKLRKQREQIRVLQEEVDKLNEIIDINEANYNKIVEDNRQMFEKITQLESTHKNYTQQVQMLKDKSLGDLNTVQVQASRNIELTKHVQKLQTQVKQFQIIIATNNREMTFTNALKERVKQLQTRIDSVQHENIKLKVHQDQNLKQINRFREEAIQLKAENAALDRELYAMKSKPDSSQSQNILFNKYEDMARRYGEVNEQSIKYKFETSNFERMLKQKQLETIRALELKHLQMQKELLENSWKQKMQALNGRFKQQTKELQTIRAGLEAKKEQYNTDIMNFKLDKDRLERSVSDLERRLGEGKEESGRISKQLAIRQEEKKLSQEKYNGLLKNLQDKVRELEKSDAENKNLFQENKQISQQLALKQQSINKQIQRITQITNNKIQMLQKDLQQKRKIIDQKQHQIRQFITKFTNQNNEKTAIYTEKQMQYQTSSVLYSRTIQDLKKDNERLHNQLQVTNKKLEQKIVESSNLLMDLKQTQSDKQLSDQQAKYKIETLSNKINDLLAEIDALRAELKNSLNMFDNQRQMNRQDRQKIQKSLYETSNRSRLLEDALQKTKIEKVTYMQREKSLRAQLEAQDQEFRKIQEKSSKIEGGNIRVKQENHYLKQIVQMLDTNYVEDEQEDENEIKILMKISQEISYLIQRNIQLETELKSTSHKSQTNDEQWLSSIQFLIESLLDYLNASELIGHKNVTKFVYSAEFKAESLYDQKQKYMVYVENFIKELFQNVVSQLSENISLYEKTFSDLRKFVESYFSSGDQRYLESLRKCLKKFDN